MSYSAYFANSELWHLLSLKGLQISSQHGNTESSIVFYIGYGVICGVMGDIATGFKFGDLALRLSIKLNAKSLEGRTQFVFNTFIGHSRQQFIKTVRLLETVYQRGLETGDLENGV
jgi:predicted ATPase